MYLWPISDVFLHFLHWCLSGHLVFANSLSNHLESCFYDTIVQIWGIVFPECYCVLSLSLLLINTLHSSMTFLLNSFSAVPYMYQSVSSTCWLCCLQTWFSRWVMPSQLSLFIYSPLCVLTLVFNLMLTGMTSCFKASIENLLWSEVGHFTF